jgi:hypothetical protein
MKQVPFIGQRKPDIAILSEAVSWSGKYRVFLGQHFVEGHLCFDVGAINNQTGMITTRHYLGRTELEAKLQKADALAFWNDFRDKMLRKPESEETDERDQITIN